MLKVDVYLPIEALNPIQEAIGPYCISNSGTYSHCMSWQKINSSWMPLENANPYIGTINQLEMAEEYVLTFRCLEKDIATVKKLILDNHPYEDATIDVYALL